MKKHIAIALLGLALAALALAQNPYRRDWYRLTNVRRVGHNQYLADSEKGRVTVRTIKCKACPAGEDAGLILNYGDPFYTLIVFKDKTECHIAGIDFQPVSQGKQ